MPRRSTPDTSTPFAEVIWEWMWAQRPPWTTAGELAYHIQVPVATAGHWLYRGVEPGCGSILPVFARLGIPLSRLLDAYAARGVPIPPLVESTHVPRAYSPPPPPRDPWELMLEDAHAAMHQAGMSDSAIDAVLDHMRAVRAGVPQLAQHINAEHAQPLVDADAPDQPTHSIHDQPTQPPRRASPSPPRGGTRAAGSRPDTKLSRSDEQSLTKPKLAPREPTSP